MPKVTLLALHMQCIINLCSKTNKNYTQYMHFKGFLWPKSVSYQGCTLVIGPSPKSPPPLSFSGFNFWPWQASSPVVAPISGYNYVKASNPSPDPFLWGGGKGIPPPHSPFPLAPLAPRLGLRLQHSTLAPNFNSRICLCAQ